MRWRWGKKAAARPHGDTAGPADGPGAAFAGGAQPSELPGPVVALLSAVQAMDPKPPVTLAMIGVMYCAHLQLSRVPSLFAAFSLCPDRVVVSQEIRRIVVAPFLHQDELQLYHNMLSLLWKGYNLEKKHGSIHFAAIVLYLVVLSELLVVATAYIIARYAFLLSGTIYECYVGFSGVICALKVILNHNAQTFTRMYNISVPTKYAAWLELLGMYIFMPKLPLATQLCGVTAGYIYTITPPATLVLTKSKGAGAYMLELLGLSKKPSRTRRAVEGIKNLGKRVFRQR